MQIIPDFELSDLNRHIDAALQSLIDLASESLFEAGKQVVDLARAKTKSEGGFGNITWNLRGSIGCVLVKDGAISNEHVYFPKLSNGSEGVKKGISYAREIALLVDDGSPVLVFVAGMEYALFVEAKGYDVISMSSIAFGGIFKNLINQIK